MHTLRRPLVSPRASAAPTKNSKGENRMRRSTNRRLQILFIGSTEHGLDLSAQAAERGWIVHLPQGTMRALGEYLFFMPHIVVIEDSGCPGWTADVFYHLRSLGEAIPLLLTGMPDLSRTENTAGNPVSYVMIAPGQTDVLLDIIADTAGISRDALSA
jgi:hypothetical protein